MSGWCFLGTNSFVYFLGVCISTVKSPNGSLSHNAHVRLMYAPLMGRTFNDSTALLPTHCNGTRNSAVRFLIGGVYKNCHDCSKAPLCTSVFCISQSEKSFQHRHSIKPWQRQRRLVLKGGVYKHCQIAEWKPVP